MDYVKHSSKRVQHMQESLHHTVPLKQRRGIAHLTETSEFSLAAETSKTLFVNSYRPPLELAPYTLPYRRTPVSPASQVQNRHVQGTGVGQP